MIIDDFQKDLPGNDMEGWSLGVGGQERAAAELTREPREQKWRAGDREHFRETDSRMWWPMGGVWGGPQISSLGEWLMAVPAEAAEGGGLLGLTLLAQESWQCSSPLNSVVSKVTLVA